MSYDFWNTIRGNRLADVLIRELPRLNDSKNKDNKEIISLLEQIRRNNIETGNLILEHLHRLTSAQSSKRQYVICDRSSIIGSIISNEINDGARLIGVYDSGYKDSVPQSTAVFEENV